MKQRKKPAVFNNYADSLARAEELASLGDQESDDFLAAVEAATQFFLEDNGGARFNMYHGNHGILCQKVSSFNWLTVNDLYQIMNGELNE